MKIRIKKFRIRPYYWNDNGQMDYLMGKVRVAEKVKHHLFSVKVKGNGNAGWWLAKSDYTVIKEK